MFYKEVLPIFYEHIKINRNPKFNSCALFLFENLKRDIWHILEFKHITPYYLKNCIANASAQLTKHFDTVDTSYVRHVKNLYQRTVNFANNHPRIVKRDENKNKMFTIDHLICKFIKIERIYKRESIMLDTLSKELHDFDHLEVDKDTLLSLIHNFTYYKYEPSITAIENNRKAFNYVADVFIEFMNANLDEITRRTKKTIIITIEDLIGI
ncbi:MAG TPA: hypothetical protein PLR26_03935 [Bacilli bacterium]|nr:hypothetical protein [Bacilli bacterium]